MKREQIKKAQKQGFSCWIPATEAERKAILAAAEADRRTMGYILLDAFRKLIRSKPKEGNRDAA